MLNHGPFIGPLLGRHNTPLVVSCNALVDGFGSCVWHKAGVLLHAVQHPLFPRPELRQDYPLNLSISLSGGKETNKDSPSNGERTGNSPT